MSEFKTFEVPSDLLDPVRKFHDVREGIRKRAAEANAAYAAAYEEHQRQAFAINHEIAAAEHEVAEALKEACLVKDGDRFTLDTSYLIEHKHAYIVMSPSLEGVQGNKGPHIGNRSLN